MTTDPERIVRLETWKDSHESRCKERYDDIKSDTEDIKRIVASMAGDLKSSVERIHSRIDTEADQSRKAVGNAIDQVGAQKVWILTTALGVVGSALAFIADKLWRAH